ncbi:MAG: hypothetical protein HQ448_06300, partial [Cytophagales bacterium]|nr:hypothetical protein [Cytophagales bacterium]
MAQGGHYDLAQRGHYGLAQGDHYAWIFQGMPKNIEKFISSVKEIYVTDAYHSLSIERYQVTPELIDRVRNGSWNAK